MMYLCRGCGAGSSLPLFFLDGMFPLRKVRNTVPVEGTITISSLPGGEL